MPHRSRRWPFAALTVALFALAALPGRAEDEEVAPKKPLKKIVVDDDTPAAGNPLALPDIARAAATQTNPVLKKFFAGFVTAYDRLNDSANRNYRIAPVPLAYTDEKFPRKEFGVYDVDDKGQASEEHRTIQRAGVRALDHFEQLALEAVGLLLTVPKGDPAEGIPLPERLAAAERLLAQVSFFHESAFEQGRRKGKGWEPIRAELGAKLAEVRVRLLEAAADARDWAKVREQAGRFAVWYRAKPDILQRLAAVRLREAEPLAASPKPDDLNRARNLLSEFESQFPGANSEVAKRVKDTLAARIAQMLGEAAEEAKKERPNKDKVGNLLRTVEGLAPDNAGLQKWQAELRAGNTTLAVGAWRLPERMSPATARYDSERQAVELVFEGLTEALPDPILGVRYRPALSVGKPTVAPLARDVTLLDGAEWVGPVGVEGPTGLFDVADFDGTIKLLRAKRELPSAEAVGWLADPKADPLAPSRVTVTLSRGHPDPRQLLTTKLLPAKWFQANRRGADDPAFAAKPFGTGPYRLVVPTPAEVLAADGPPTEIAFTANPAYFRRPGRQPPGFREVRFVHLNRVVNDIPLDPVVELKAERLHVVPDFPTRDYARYAELTNATVATAAVNRRIHLLAFNLRDPRSQSADLRRAVQLAVNRTKILDDVYRAGKPQFHKPLTGPFPVGSWAEAKPVAGAGPDPLFNRDLAAGLFAKLSGNVTLDLLYAADDPQAKATCEAIAGQVNAASNGKVRLDPQGVSPADLHKRVTSERRFGMAYLTHDYADDWYPLGLANYLDPDAAGTGGRNATGFGLKQSAPTAADDTLAQRLMDATRTRDFEGRLRPLAHDIHRQFADSVPFVPLWQLDRHIAISKRVKIQFDGSSEEVPAERLDPTVLFQNVGRWQLR